MVTKLAKKTAAQAPVNTAARSDGRVGSKASAKSSMSPTQSSSVSPCGTKAGSGPLALVTGASSGIGEALAH